MNTRKVTWLEEAKLWLAVFWSALTNQTPFVAPKDKDK
jgi:hypothetical protein